MIWSSIQGTMENGNRIKCFAESEQEGILFCNRTHEVRDFNRIGDIVLLVNTRSITRNVTCEYGYDADNWLIIRTQPMILGRSAMNKTYYLAYCPDHHSSAVREILNVLNPPQITVDATEETTPERCNSCLYSTITTTRCDRCSQEHSLYADRTTCELLEHGDRDCENCRYCDLGATSHECTTCSDGFSDNSNWTPIETATVIEQQPSEQLPRRMCNTCVHRDRGDRNTDGTGTNCLWCTSSGRTIESRYIPSDSYAARTCNNCRYTAQTSLCPIHVRSRCTGYSMWEARGNSDMPNRNTQDSFLDGLRRPSTNPIADAERVINGRRRDTSTLEIDDFEIDNDAETQRPETPRTQNNGKSIWEHHKKV